MWEMEIKGTPFDKLIVWPQDGAFKWRANVDSEYTDHWGEGTFEDVPKAMNAAESWYRTNILGEAADDKAVGQ